MRIIPCTQYFIMHYDLIYIVITVSRAAQLLSIQMKIKIDSLPFSVVGLVVRMWCWVTLCSGRPPWRVVSYSQTTLTLKPTWPGSKPGKPLPSLSAIPGIGSLRNIHHFTFLFLSDIFWKCKEISLEDL